MRTSSTYHALGLLGLTVPSLAGVAACSAPKADAITIKTDSKLQKIDGFGFSQAFTRAAEFQAADPQLSKAALDLFFDKKNGAGFSIIRNWIPSSSNYTIEPNSPGSPSSTPQYRWDGWDEGQVWFTKQARSYGVKTIYADAWSAPGFMKTSGDEAKPGFLCGTPGHECASGDWRQAYADYLVQYVEFYKKEGIDITHLGFLNEPDFKPSYSNMQISDNASEAIDFIPILRKTVDHARLDVSLTCCDATGWDKQAEYTKALVAAGMQRDLDVITSHMYSSDATYPLDTILPTWISEAGVETSSGRFVPTWYSTGNVNEGLAWAIKIAKGLVDANLNAYLFWEGFEINQQQSASHLLDTTGPDQKTILPSGIFYAFSMFSRFIRPDAYRVAIEGTDKLADVITAAFQNTDKSVIVVFTNTGAANQSTEILVPPHQAGSSAKAWLTDNDHKIEKTPVEQTRTNGHSSIKVDIPAHSVVTVKFA
ncbi:Exo-beta-1,4-xylanase [Penicillium ucsense]|uniref:Exo-beta-1,4-xylanase n=1 Tax=Penicillium ucsense TaxID=2839758 RepID=A0A8J8W4Q7_9EURO|nr:Exo-beta-1,4-xylanase [Penicillium ucsense]KAF7737793.1 Exo-beta-1,4-xylanase [Penicillium ucsense]